MLRLMEEGGKRPDRASSSAPTASRGPYSAASEITEATKLFVRHRAALAGRSRPGSPRHRARSCAPTPTCRHHAAQRMLGAEVPPVVEPEPGDNRFKDPEWARNPYFDFWKQAYLITTRWLDDVLDKTEGLDERTRQRPSSTCKQLASALSPSNFPMTNPEVLRETLASNGREPRAGHGQPRARHGASRATSSASARRTCRPSRSAATSPPRPARSSSRTSSSSSSSTRPRTDKRARAAAADRAAVDQQVLHPRSRPGQKSFIRYMVGQGLHRVRGLLGQPGRAPLAQDLRGLHDRRASSRPPMP